jgi:hypothetical protein
MTEREFIKVIQTRTARVSISASATRGQGSGVVKSARDYLSEMPLRQLSVSSSKAFRTRLDECTDGLLDALPKQGASWGLARKLLNIFIRDSLYTTYLCDAYNLRKSEGFLEIPLDSITGKKLRESKLIMLPRWPGVKHITPEVSELYQTCATELAKRERVAAVHLDALLWAIRS